MKYNMSIKIRGPSGRTMKIHSTGNPHEFADMDTALKFLVKNLAENKNTEIIGVYVDEVQNESHGC
jgi:hypothetical protein